MEKTRQHWMGHRYLVALLCLSSGLASCAHGRLSPVSPDVSAQETIAIYTVVIHDMYIVPWQKYVHPIRQVIVTDSTVDLHRWWPFTPMRSEVDQMEHQMRHDLPGVPPELFTTFLVANATRTRLPWFAVVDSIPVRFLSNTTLRQAFTPVVRDTTWAQFLADTLMKGWEPFYRHYPQSQGILRLSRVSVDQTQHWALVYAGNQAGGLWGSGYLIVLHRSQDTWQIRSKMMLWQS